MGDLECGKSVLICHPCFGSMWLGDAEYYIAPETGRRWVEGSVWHGTLEEKSWYHFPVSCVRKDPDGLLQEEPKVWREEEELDDG